MASIIANADSMFEKKTKFFWFYGAYQKLFTDLKNKYGDKVEFHEGLPSTDTIEKIASKTALYHPVLIIDDLFHDCINSEVVVNLFTKDAHHRGLSNFILCQNAFTNGKYSRTISLNAKIIIWFNNPRDQSQIRHLSYQMYPNNPKFLTAAFRDATSSGAHSYLLLDFHQSTPEKLRVKTKILPTDDVNIVHTPK